jgi:diaminohydroxyphosphoribosylaminopyrimidine deaminase/5-amino-6-(5-phosphoribosylamino)uracil reductase
MDAVMVGIGTVLSDDPLLTVRNYRKRKYVRRIVLDASLKTPLRSRLLKTLDEGEVIIFTSKKAGHGKRKQLEEQGAVIFSVPEDQGKLSLPSIMKKISDLGITSVLLEAGSTLAWAALAQKIVTKVYFFYGTIIMGGAKAPSVVGGKGFPSLDDAIRLRDISMSKRGEDFLLQGYPVYK